VFDSSSIIACMVYFCSNLMLLFFDYLRLIYHHLSGRYRRSPRMRVPRQPDTVEIPTVEVRLLRRLARRWFMSSPRWT
jgi:hypothetical protein